MSNLSDWKQAGEEREAIARLKQGDIGGLECLARLHYVRSVRAAYLVCLDPALAEDITQAAFVRAYERIAQFDDSRPFAPWLLRGVVNDAVKASRKRERYLSLNRYTDGEELELPSPEATLQELAESAETSEAIWRAISKLTPEQRGAIVMRYYLDLGEAEMASRLQVPPGTVKSRLSAARATLRRTLPEWVRPGTNDR